jgi:ribonuclease-3
MSLPRIDYSFDQDALLQQALTHRSAGNRNNERLEFLGDGVLNFVIAAILYERFPDAPEGDLSRLRARLVRKETLAHVGRELELGQHLLLGPGELKSGGHRRDSIVADAVEAVLGAVYLDGGFKACRKLILEWFEQRLDSLPPAEDLKDAKTRLQEYLQARQQPLPDYQLHAANGAEHARVFTVVCTVPSMDLTEQGQGTTRRKAEQAAAKALLDQISKS